jgi:hypothetical protein
MHGCTVRVKPVHKDNETDIVPGCITWAG